MKTLCFEMARDTAHHFKLQPALDLDHVTFESWIRLDPSVRLMVFVWESGSSGARRRNALRLAHGTLWRIAAADGGFKQQEPLLDGLPLWDGRWHHLAFAIENGTLCLYENGALVREVSSPLLASQPIEECGPLLWGLSESGASALALNARVWSRALGPAEIARSMRHVGPLAAPGLAMDCGIVNGAVTNRVNSEAGGAHWTTLALHHRFALGDSAPQSYVINDVDVTLTQDMLPQDQDVVVYADTITLAPAIAHRGNLTLFARHVDFAGATVNLSGATGSAYPPGSMAGPGNDGTTPGAGGTKGGGGQPGGNGGAGGDLSVTASDCAGTLTFTSNGGNGGAGQGGGPGATGAQGAQGRDCTAGGDTCSGWSDDPQPGGQGGAAGPGGDAGPSGNGGNAGSLIIHTVAAPYPQQQATVTATPGSGPSPAAQPGPPGLPGGGGIGGRHMESHSSDTFGISYCGYSDSRAPTGPPGAVAGKGNPPTGGTPGAPGQISIATVAASALQSGFPITLALRTLHKAERAYLNSDYATAAAILTWLQQACPSTGTEWTPLQTRLATLVSQLSRGSSYYGRPRNSVPLADVMLYLQTLTGLIADADTLEQDYFHFTDLQQTVDARIAALQNQLGAVTTAVGQLQTQLTTVANQQGPTNDAINQLEVQIQAQYTVLANAATAFQDAVREKTNCDTFLAVLTAVQSIVTTTVGGVSDLQDMQKALEGLDGSFGDIQVIVKQINTAVGDLQSIKDAWSGLAGIISGGSADSGKILTDKAQFDETIQPYLGMPEAQAYKQAMDDYLSLIQARNQKIIEFDSLVVLESQIQATITQKNAESDRVSALIADVANRNPNLADYVAFMEGAYLDMQTLLLRYLFEGNAAMNYYTLGDAVLHVGTPGQPTSMGDIAAAASSIQATLTTYINNSSGPQQSFDLLQVTLTAAAPGVFQDAQNDPFGQFLAGDSQGNHTIAVAVPIGTMPGRYQLTGTAFTIAVPDFVTTDGSIMIRLTHSGYAPFLDANGNVAEFSHLPVAVYYSYLVRSDGSSQPTGGGSLSSTNYIGLSPCTSWTLTIRGSENPGLDLSKVTQIDLNFSGLCRLTAEAAGVGAMV